MRNLDNLYVLPEHEISDLYKLILFSNVRYIIVETENSCNHIELLPPTVKDRGRFKWLAEDKNDATMTIDGSDMFPRLYFLLDSFMEELSAWLFIRNQKIIEIAVPLDFSPDFNAEFYESYLKLKMTIAMTKNTSKES